MCADLDMLATTPCDANESLMLDLATDIELEEQVKALGMSEAKPTQALRCSVSQHYRHVVLRGCMA